MKRRRQPSRFRSNDGLIFGMTCFGAVGVRTQFEKLISLVCERLITGAITAIDRSPKMIEVAARRNPEHIEASPWSA